MGTIYRNGTAFIGSGGAGGVELTQAEYDALPETEKMNGSIYFISDGEASYPSASTMRYDNSTSGLTATSVQAAVDEVNEKVNDNAGDIATLNNDLTQLNNSIASVSDFQTFVNDMPLGLTRPVYITNTVTNTLISTNVASLGFATKLTANIVSMFLVTGTDTLWIVRYDRNTGTVSSSKSVTL